MNKRKRLINDLLEFLALLAAPAILGTIGMMGLMAN